MTLRITTLYPEYQRIQTNFETCPKDENTPCNQSVFKVAFKRTSIDPELYADVMQMRQNCTEYASAVNSLNAKADDKRKYKPVFGVLKTKEGKPDYLKTGVYALSFLPPLRRMQSSFDAAEDENYFRVAGPSL
ncbi:MAG: hypothetical protein GX568_07460 [Candidatus Gastranaerophilales bacterium]|nr:hypothetical protein [Candidatus Gastranaerophilales bacterium]